MVTCAIFRHVICCIPTCSRFLAYPRYCQTTCFLAIRSRNYIRAESKFFRFLILQILFHNRFPNNTGSTCILNGMVIHRISCPNTCHSIRCASHKPGILFLICSSRLSKDFPSVDCSKTPGTYRIVNNRIQKLMHYRSCFF